MGNEMNEGKKNVIEITNLKKAGSLKLGFKDINGNSIDFVYGMTIDENMVDKEMLEKSLNNGLLGAYLYKGWVVKGKINVNNKIIGSPVKIEKIDNKEEINKIEAKNTLTNRLPNQEPKVIRVEDIKMDANNNIIDETVKNKLEAKTEEVKKQRGRPKKDVSLSSSETTVASNNNVTEIKNKENVTEGITDTPSTTINATNISDKKEDEDFL
jgi:hypothetical protein